LNLKNRNRKSTGKGKKRMSQMRLWDPNGPQSAVKELVNRWEIRGSILEVGCGAGDNVLYLAEHGHEAWGIDSDRNAIHRAKEKAARRRIQAVFQVGDPLQSANWGVYVDNIIDCGLFHTLADGNRAKFENALRQSLRPRGHFFLLCYSDQQPERAGPRRITQKEILRTFAKKWHVNYIVSTRMKSADHPRGAQAWLANLTPRTPSRNRKGEKTSSPVPVTGRGVGGEGGPTSRTLPRAIPQADIPGSHHLEMEPLSIAADQHCDNWCWAASLQMLAKSQGIDLAQEWFVKKIYGASLPCKPSGSFENIQRAIEGVSEKVNGTTVTLSGAFHYGIPTNPAGMIQAIEDKRPFIFGYAGHAYVCYGLTWLEQQPFVRVIQLNLIDPLWKLIPSRPELNTFNVFRDPLILINGTFEMLVRKS
jgi:SAM-dependent methyltransferase